MNQPFWMRGQMNRPRNQWNSRPFLRNQQQNYHRPNSGGFRYRHPHPHEQSYHQNVNQHSSGGNYSYPRERGPSPGPLPGSEGFTQKKIQETSKIIQSQINDDEGNFTSRFSQNQEANTASLAQSIPETANNNVETFIRPNSLQQKPAKPLYVQPNSSKSPFLDSDAKMDMEEISHKIKNYFASMSANKKMNFVNMGSASYGPAVEELQRQKRVTLSKELRDVLHKERSIKECQVFNEIIPDIGIKLEALPDEFIAHLSSTLNIELERQEIESPALFEPQLQVPMPIKDECNEKILDKYAHVFPSFEDKVSPVDFGTTHDSDISDPFDFNYFNTPPPAKCNPFEDYSKDAPKEHNEDIFVGSEQQHSNAAVHVTPTIAPLGQNFEPSSSEEGKHDKFKLHRPEKIDISPEQSEEKHKPKFRRHKPRNRQRDYYRQQNQDRSSSGEVPTRSRFESNKAFHEKMKRRPFRRDERDFDADKSRFSPPKAKTEHRNPNEPFRIPKIGYQNDGQSAPSRSKNFTLRRNFKENTEKPVENKKAIKTLAERKQMPSLVPNINLEEEVLDFEELPPEENKTCEEPATPDVFKRLSETVSEVIEKLPKSSLGENSEASASIATKVVKGNNLVIERDPLKALAAIKETADKVNHSIKTSFENSNEKLIVESSESALKSPEGPILKRKLESSSDKKSKKVKCSDNDNVKDVFTSVDVVEKTPIEQILSKVSEIVQAAPTNKVPNATILDAVKRLKEIDGKISALLSERAEIYHILEKMDSGTGSHHHHKEGTCNSVYKESEVPPHDMKSKAEIESSHKKHTNVQKKTIKETTVLKSNEKTKKIDKKDVSHVDKDKKSAAKNNKSISDLKPTKIVTTVPTIENNSASKKKRSTKKNISRKENNEDFIKVKAEEMEVCEEKNEANVQLDKTQKDLPEQELKVGSPKEDVKKLPSEAGAKRRKSSSNEDETPAANKETTIVHKEAPKEIKHSFDAKLDQIYGINNIPKLETKINITLPASASLNATKGKPKKNTKKKRSKLTMQSSRKGKPKSKAAISSVSILDESQDSLLESPKEIAEGSSTSDLNSFSSPPKSMNSINPLSGHLVNQIKELTTNVNVNLTNFTTDGLLKLAAKIRDRGAAKRAKMLVPHVTAETELEESAHNKNDKGEIVFTDWNGSIISTKLVENILVAGNDLGFLYYYDFATGKLIDERKLSEKPITSMVTYKLDETSTLCVGNLDGFLHFINCDDRCSEKAIDVERPIQCLESSWDFLFLGTSDGYILTYDIKTSKLHDPISISQQNILVIRATLEGARRVLLVAMKNSHVTIRDAMSGLLLRTMEDTVTPTVYSLLLHNNLIYCGTSHHDILIYSFSEGHIVQKFQDNNGSGAVCLSIFKNLLFVGCYNGHIYIYDISTNKFVSSMDISCGMILVMAVIDYKIVTSTNRNCFKCLPLPQSVMDHIK